MTKFYKTFDDVINERFDGLIITGAPVEQISFEEVDYWKELCGIMEWSKTNVCSTLHICWGAQAGLYFHYGIPKYNLSKKMFGVFPHKAEVSINPLLRGFDEKFNIPHSRHTEIRRMDVERVRELKILASSPESGIAIISDETDRQFFIMGHLEYDRFTLANEYFRDKEKSLPIEIPKHYFPYDDPSEPPHFNWRSHANLLFSNWLNYCVYQKTPYRLEELEPLIY